jgi:phosphopentomutase
VKTDRVFLVILDSCGCGALPDAAEYGDAGAATLQHTLEANPGWDLPGLMGLGLGRILGEEYISNSPAPKASWGMAATLSKGKDTTTGHWEMMGCVMENPLPVYPGGFPAKVIEEFSRRTGRGVLGNIAASGTEIIERLGPEQIATGRWIVYTSADSVFQIAAHEEVIPLEELYEACRIAREILKAPNEVSRVIARPYVGETGAFTRTGNRRDYPIPPPRKTALEFLHDAGKTVIGLGKIGDIFLGRGLTEDHHTADNAEGQNLLLEILDRDFEGLCFLNLNDFDSKYGHRRNPVGYYEALKGFDDLLPSIVERITQRDMLILTADHGCDPTHTGTDHTREYVPILTYSSLVEPRESGVRESLADIGSTILKLFNLESDLPGKSFL